ncbi:MAG: hypothetical protein RL328_888, partial [Acidobacteriota bacterium]
DLDLAGKLDKVLYYAQQVPPLEQMEQSWIRLGLMAKHLGQGPTDFHYRPIEPNYKEYWMPDSDAINALDRQEMARWFTSRGDECLNCGDVFLNPNDELIIRVHK